MLGLSHDKTTTVYNRAPGLADSVNAKFPDVQKEATRHHARARAATQPKTIGQSFEVSDDHYVPHTAATQNDCRLAHRIELTPKPCDIDVNHIGARIVKRPPIG